MKRAMFAFGLAAMVVGTPAMAKWVPAWSASPQPVWTNKFLFPTKVPAELKDVTVRQRVHIGYRGTRLRLQFSNTYGTKPVTIAGVHIAPSGSGADIDERRDAAVLFGGSQTVTLPAGASIVSDAVAMPAGGDNLSVSIRFDKPTPVGTFHWDGHQTAYLLAGDQLSTARPAVT